MLSEEGLILLLLLLRDRHQVQPLQLCFFPPYKIVLQYDATQHIILVSHLSYKCLSGSSHTF